jgi:zinc D-Ala-D-Ala carboxypeptidase
MRLTPHFTLDEFAVSASHPGLVEPVPAGLQTYCRLLALLALEPARIALGRPLRILSGYRPDALNRAVGGSPTSQHRLAQAADVGTPDPAALLAWIRAAQPVGIGQVILYPARQFVHVALVSTKYPTLTLFSSTTSGMTALPLP